MPGVAGVPVVCRPQCHVSRQGDDLVRLAEMAAARHQGVSIAEIAAEFGADYRTA
jgi:hypothetical protein